VSPELLSPAWFSALASIIVIDLILAGDNALVIGLAARNVPAEFQRRVIWWGTLGAIVVRALLTVVVVWLLKIPGFLLIGGIALVYIGWKLTHGGGDSSHTIEAQSSVRGAVQTIVIADAVMGVDNVLAVGGAAHGSMLLVVIGLAVSVPIVIWGSTLVLKWVERFPAILWLGAAVLGWTGAKMIASEPLVAATLGEHHVVRALLYAVIVGGLVATPVFRALRPSHRFQAAVIIVVAAWLTVFGWLDDRLSEGLDPAGAWQWDESLVDFVRWVGWIPLVIGLSRWLASDARAKASPHRRGT
jgi:YjbE family integral membrane protein